MAKIAMRSKVRAIVRTSRIDTHEKKAIVLLDAHTLTVHPGIANILAGTVMIARNERDPALLQQWRENVTKKCVFGASSLMRDIARDDDMFYVVEHEPFDERFRALGRRTEVQVRQMGQTSIDHGPIMTGRRDKQVSAT